MVWGVSGGSGGADWEHKVPALRRLMTDAGIVNTRLGISWADIERQRGTYNFTATDRLLDFVRDAGINVIACFCTTPGWASGTTPGDRKLFRERHCEHLLGVVAPAEEFLPDYRRYCEAVARHFRGRVKYYELWNEPDGMGMPIPVRNENGETTDIRWGGDPEVYARLLKETYIHLRQGDPDCVVAVGGLDGRPRVDFIEGLYAHGAQPYFQAVCLHPYPHGGRDELAWAWVDAVREVMVKHGDQDKQIWITEYGWNVRPGGQFPAGAAKQARLIEDSILAMRQRPYITQAIYHTLNDWRTREQDPQSVVCMGLTQWDLSPRPAYQAFQRACARPPGCNQLRNPGFEQEAAGENSTPGVAPGWQNTDGRPHREWYALDDQTAYAGRRSQRISFGRGAKPDLTVWQATPVGSAAPGRTYEASVYTKCKGLKDAWGGLRLALRFMDADAKVLEEHRAPLAPECASGWRRIYVRATAPRRALRSQIVLFLHSESGTVWYDEATVRLVD